MDDATLGQTEGHQALASDLMETVPVVSTGATVGDASAGVAADPGVPAYVAVCQAGYLRGLVPAAALLGAEPSAPVAHLVQPAQVVVSTTARAEQAAHLAAHARAEVVAVTDDDGQFQGLIPAHRLVPLLVHEHEIDLARLGGFMRGTIRARTASEEPLLRRIWHRAPWLLLGLAGSVLAAQIVRAFEDELESTLALAFFLPGIVYMADAVGTQTETLVIRGLSVGVQTRKILRLELLTGSLIGALLSIAMFPLALAMTGDTGVAGVVAVALMASASCATLVALALPWLLQQFDFDPAFGSGPLATVMQDLLSILIYFGVAVTLL